MKRSDTLFEQPSCNGRCSSIPLYTLKFKYKSTLGHYTGTLPPYLYIYIDHRPSTKAIPKQMVTTTSYLSIMTS